MNEFRPSGGVATLLGRIEALVPHDAQAHAVGGTVRDVLLGRELHDIDIVIDTGARAFAQLLADRLDGYYVPLDDARDVARVVFRGASNVKHLDVAQRQGSLEEDLRLRDFTVDALGAPLVGGEIVDVTGGIVDLSARLVRMTGAKVFDADPLRLLRGARLASELGWEVEAATRSEIRLRASGVVGAAGERRRDELARILMLSDAYGALRLLDELDLLDALLPEVTFGRGVAQPEDWHAYDVFEHNLRTVEALDVMLAEDAPGGERSYLWAVLWDAFGWCEEDLRSYLAEVLTEGRSRGSLLKFAGLLHDVAKPQTKTVEADGRIHFHGHGEQGAAVARRIMRRLRFSARETGFVSVLVEQHLRPVQLAQVGEAPTRRALYRFYRDLGDAVPGVLMLSLADAAASRGPRMTSADWSRHVLYMESLLLRSEEEEGILDPPRLVDGNDIMRRLGMPAGPVIGKLLEALREAQAAGDVTDVAGAWAFLEEQVARHGENKD